VAGVLEHDERAHALAVHHGLRLAGLGHHRLDVFTEQRGRGLPQPA